MLEYENIPLSYAQSRLWLLRKIDGLSPTYNMPLAMRLSGELDSKALQAALNDVLVRHESLRTLFRDNEGVPFQNIVSPAEARMVFEEADVTASQLPVALAEAAQHCFDVAVEFPIRAKLFRVGDKQNVLLLLLDHTAQVYCTSASNTHTRTRTGP